MDEKDGIVFLNKKLKLLNTKDHSTRKNRHIIDDFYLLKNGDELGRKLIPTHRIAFYEELLATVSSKTPTTESNLNNDLLQFFGIFCKLLNSLPSDHFQIDLRNNTIQRID